MANAQLTAAIGQFQRWAGRHAGGRGDAELVERFAYARSEAAFEALLHRFGPMVLGVCRRLLYDPNDVEDAFQATFLVFLRKADRIERRELIGKWLYGVAFRVAQRARSQKSKSHPLAETALPAVNNAEFADLRPIIDEEIARLPEKYRAPFILCHLQGKSRQEAAKQLGWKEGTLSGRLARARERLQGRLTRRGVTLGAGVFATALSQSTANATVPMMLISATLKAVLPAGKTAGVLSAAGAGLAEGVLQTMIVSKLKYAAVVLIAVGLIGTGAGVATHRAFGRLQGEKKTPAKAAPKAETKPAEVKKPAVDLYGDPLPEGAIARLGTVRMRGVGEAVFLPDGKTIATTSGNIIDYETGRVIHRFVDSEKMIEFPAKHLLSLDGKRWVNVSWKELQVLEMATGRELQRFKNMYKWSYSVALTPNGDKVLWTDEANLCLWDVTMGREVKRIPVEQAIYDTVALSPDGKLAACAPRLKNAIRIYDLEKEQEIAAIPTVRDRTHLLEFSPDGTKLAWADYPSLHLHLWDATARKELWQFKTDPLVSVVAFTADGSRLATGGHEPPVYILNVADGKEITRLNTATNHGGLSFSPDGKRLVISGKDAAIRVWDIVSGTELGAQAGLPGEFRWARLLPNGRQIVTINGEKLRLWDAATGKEIRRFEPRAGVVVSACLSADGQKLAAVPFVNNGQEDHVYLWDVQTGDRLKEWVTSKQRLHTGLDFTRDGKTLVSGDSDAMIIVWDCETGKAIRSMENSISPVRRSTVSPDGKVYVANEGGICAWEIATGKSLWKNRLPQEMADTISVSPDGRWLAASIGWPNNEKSYAVIVCDAATGQEKWRVATEPRRGAKVAFTPDGKMLMIGDAKALRLFEMRSIKQREQLRGFDSYIRSIDLATDQKRLVVAYFNGQALVWNFPDVPEMVAVTGINLEKTWQNLASLDAAKAWTSMKALMAAPKPATAFLRERLKPVIAIDEKRIARMIADLDSAKFDVREKAFADLKQAAEAAETHLTDALAKKPSPEAKRRIDGLLDELDKPITDPEKLRTLRAIEVLEHIATPEARAVLQTLAAGATAALATKDAKAALERLAKRKS